MAAPNDPSSASSVEASALDTITAADAHANAHDPNSNAPRRCFICLTDEEPSDPPNSWVHACPCTLTAHQDCAQSWVTDCERSGKPLQCPVCKYKVELEGPWDPVVALSDVVSRRFTRASPLVLFTGVSLGVHLSLHAYGLMALWAFSGKDVAVRFLTGAHMTLDGHRRTLGSFGERARGSLVLVSIAPALLFGQLLPGLSNKIALPGASLYGMWHVMHDEYFFSWPPSPQLAMAVFPYIRSIYYNLWREFVFPREVKLNRQILGLPPLEETQNRDRAQNNNDNNNNNNNRRNDRAEGGILWFLQNLLDALEPDEDGQGDDGGDQVHLVNEEINVAAEAAEGGVVVELVIEEAADDDEGIAPDLAEDEPPQNAAPEARQAPAEHDDPQDGGEPAQGADNNQAADDQPRHNHEAPPAPPAQRAGLTTVLSAASNSLVSALILPSISFAMGEVLRLVLPRSWTASPTNPWHRYGPLGRPGFMQQQWGRSLVGGCLFVVVRDAVRLYTKYRKAVAMGQRRVKNVDKGRLRERR